MRRDCGLLAAGLLALPLLTAGLAGCGGGAPVAEQPQGLDREYRNDMRLARIAFSEGRYSQAALLYDLALEDAKRADAIGPISDAAFERALTALRLNDGEEAVLLAERTEAELTRRGAAPGPRWTVVAAWGHYLEGQDRLARQLVQGMALAPAGLDSELQERAAMLLGLIAADARDRALLDQAIASMAAAGAPEASADMLELRAHAAWLAGDASGARTQLLEVARLRRSDLDLNGLARALGAAGDAALASGQPAVAADLYLRAGRATIQDGELSDESRAWLQAAAELARRQGLKTIESEASDLLTED